MNDQKNYQGQVVGFGVANYQHDPNNNKSYFVEIKQEHGNKTIWAIGLQEQMEKQNIQIGENVNLIDFGVKDGEKRRSWSVERHEPYQNLANMIEHDVEREQQKSQQQSISIEKSAEEKEHQTQPKIQNAEIDNLPDSIKNNYIAIIKNRLLSDEKINYYDKSDPNQVNIAFEDRKNSLNTSRQDEKTIHAMMDLAESKGWTAIKLKGTEEFKQKAWLEASLRGIETKGYTPNEKDLAELQAKQQARTINQVEMTAQKPPQTKEYSEHNHENHQKQPSINEAFNQQLQDLIDGKLNERHIFQLGKPSDILLNTGFPNTPIELKASKLWEKSQTDWHKFDIASAKDLPKALQEPMAVFAYGDKNKSQNVITEIEHDGKKFVVGVHFNQMQDGVEINSVRGFFPKDNPEWLNWIAQDKALYLDKEKVQTLIAQQRTNLADVSYLDLNLVENIVQNFSNVKQNNEKVVQTEQLEQTQKDKYTQPTPSLSSITINWTEKHGEVNQKFNNFEQVQSWYKQEFTSEYMVNNPNLYDKSQLTIYADNVPDEAKAVNYNVSVGIDHFNPHQHNLEQNYIHEYQADYEHFGVNLQEMLNHWAEYDKSQENQNIAYEQTTNNHQNTDQEKSINSNVSSDDVKKLSQQLDNVDKYPLKNEDLVAIQSWKNILETKYKSQPDFINKKLNDLNDKIPDIASGKFQLPKAPDTAPSVEVRTPSQGDKSRSR